MQQIFDWFTFSNISGLASIVGLFFTIYVFLGIRVIQKEFLFRIRLPSLLKKLQQHASTISNQLQKYPETKHEIIEELSIAKVNINSLYKKSSGSIKTSLKKLETNIDVFRKSELTDNSKQSLREIYMEMNMVIQEISNLRDDDKWRQGNNG